MSPGERLLIQHFLKTLTRIERLIVVLYYYEEMTINQIGAVLDMPAIEVRKILDSIIAWLKGLLNPDV